MGRRGQMLAVLALLALLAAGCGGGDDSGDTGDGGEEASPEPAAAATEAPDGDAGAGDEGTDDATVQVIDSDLGKILADAEGNVLYLFTNDSGPESTCYDDCAATWPPLLADGPPTAGEGVTASELSTSPREDGGEQVTYAGRPLYHFAGDEQPGDTNGQGVGGVWFAVTPTGEPVEGTAGGDSGDDGGGSLYDGP